MSEFLDFVLDCTPNLVVVALAVYLVVVNLR
jgi:hypothetical protein